MSEIQKYTIDFESIPAKEGEVYSSTKVFCSCGWETTHLGYRSSWADGEIHARRHLMKSEPIIYMMAQGPREFATKEEWDKGFEDG